MVLGRPAEVVAITEGVLERTEAGRLQRTLQQSDLPKDAGILRTAAQHNQANVGVYADVIAGGRIRRGDSVTIV